MHRIWKTPAVFSAGYRTVCAEAYSKPAIRRAFLRLLTTQPVFRDAEYEKAWLIRTTLHRACDIRRPVPDGISRWRRRFWPLRRLSI